MNRSPSTALAGHCSVLVQFLTVWVAADVINALGEALPPILLTKVSTLFCTNHFAF